MTLTFDLLTLKYMSFEDLMVKHFDVKFGDPSFIGF